MKGAGNLGEVMDKPPVIGSNSKKSAQFTTILQSGELRDSRCDPGVGLQDLRSYQVAKVLNLLSNEMALPGLKHQARITQSLNHLMQVLKVVLQGAGEHKNIVNINSHVHVV